MNVHVFKVKNVQQNFANLVSEESEKTPSRPLVSPGNTHVCCRQVPPRSLESPRGRYSGSGGTKVHDSLYVLAPSARAHI